MEKMSVFLWLQSFYVKFTSWTWCHTAVNIFDTFFVYIFLFLLPIDFCVIILHCGNAMVCKSMCDINSNHSSFFIAIHFSQWIFPFDVVAIFVKQCFRFISILLCMQPLIRSHFKPFTFNIHQFTIYLYYGAMKKKILPTLGDPNLSNRTLFHLMKWTLIWLRKKQMNQTRITIRE